MISKSHTKYIQSLQHKKFRDESGQFIAETPKTVLELLDSGRFFCREIYATSDWLLANENIALLNPKTKFGEVKDFELEKISALTTPNKVLGVFEKRKYPGDVEFEGKISLLLDTIQDPGNLGTIIRIADWFGIENIICSEHCADMYNPKVVQSTMGSLTRVNIFYENLEGWLKNNTGIKVYVTALEGEAVNKMKPLKEAAIIIGNESKGVNESLMEMVHEKITIPKIGEAESLNAAVATGIILSHVV